VDLDLPIAIYKENLKRIAEALGSLGFRPRLPVAMEEFRKVESLRRRHEEKSMQVFTTKEVISNALIELKRILGVRRSYRT